MRLEEEMLNNVDKWRANQNDVPSRAEAMRRLIEFGLMRTGAETVKFSDGEKLIVMMIGDIYKNLKVKGEIDLEFINGVVYGGHYWAPKCELQSLFHDHEDNPNDVRFVCDVLDMWSFIEEAYEKLFAEDKAQLDKNVGYVQFIGFDGNNESSHLSITRFFIDRMNRFSRFKGRELNSHSQKILSY